jgi:hypothetical protein
MIYVIDFTGYLYSHSLVLPAFDLLFPVLLGKWIMAG